MFSQRHLNFFTLPALWFGYYSSAMSRRKLSHAFFYDGRNFVFATACKFCQSLRLTIWVLLFSILEKETVFPSSLSKLLNIFFPCPQWAKAREKHSLRNSRIKGKGEWEKKTRVAKLEEVIIFSPAIFRLSSPRNEWKNPKIILTLASPLFQAHNDLIRTYEAKLQSFGVPTEELGFKPLESNIGGQQLGRGPAGLVAAPT